MTTPKAEEVGAVAVGGRLDRLPNSRYLLGLVVRNSQCGFSDFSNTLLVAYIALGLSRANIFTATNNGLFDPRGFASFADSEFAGMSFGNAFCDWLSDRYGRKKISA
jgi:hypothetical protein